MFKALLTLLVMASATQALSNPLEIRPSIVEVGEWEGSYEIKYFPMTPKGRSAVFQFGIGQVVWSSKGAMGINFGNTDDTIMNSGQDLLGYQYSRDVQNGFGSNETDQLNCMPPNGTKYKSIPRKVIIKAEAMARVDAALAAGMIDEVTAAQKKAGVEGLFDKVVRGFHAKAYKNTNTDLTQGLHLGNEIVAVIFGKKCNPGDAQKLASGAMVFDDLEDLTVPVIEVTVTKDNTGNAKKLDMKAVLNPYLYSGRLYQGFSIYTMEPTN